MQTDTKVVVGKVGVSKQAVHTFTVHIIFTAQENLLLYLKSKTKAKI